MKVKTVLIFAIQNGFLWPQCYVHNCNAINATTVLYMRPQCYIGDHSGSYSTVRGQNRIRLCGAQSENRDNKGD